jgi:hypothetical protein
MGDIADLILDGTLDEETGEYIGDHNLEKYGSESPGFPVSINREAREERKQKARNIAKNTAQKKTKCPECGKKVKIIGLAMHRRDVHNI